MIWKNCSVYTSQGESKLVRCRSQKCMVTSRNAWSWVILVMCLVWYYYIHVLWMTVWCIGRKDGSHLPFVTSELLHIVDRSMWFLPFAIRSDLDVAAQNADVPLKSRSDFLAELLSEHERPAASKQLKELWHKWIESKYRGRNGSSASHDNGSACPGAAGGRAWTPSPEPSDGHWMQCAEKGPQSSLQSIVRYYWMPRFATESYITNDVISTYYYTILPIASLITTYFYIPYKWMQVITTYFYILLQVF